MSTGDLKREVLKYYLRAHEDRLMSGTSGNASAFSPGENVMVITPSGTDHKELTEKLMVVVTLDGEAVEGDLPPSSEWRMHAEVYRAAGETGAILHTHSVYATAFAVAGKHIPEILPEMNLFLGGGVPLCGYAPAGSARLAEAVAETLKSSPVCLMRNHGVTAYGKDPQSAYIRAAYVEEAAKIYCIAKQIGGDMRL